LTAEGTTSKGTGSISCEVVFCNFYRFSLRTLRTKDVSYITYDTHFEDSTRHEFHSSEVSNQKNECYTSRSSTYFCIGTFRIKLARTQKHK
jgi:hypothetical protein